MKKVIIGCKTLENEVVKTMEDCGVNCDILWFPSGLHNTPNKLTEALRELLAQAKDYTHALFAMGYCGNSLVGLESDHLTMVIPRVDDCISLLFGSYTKRRAIFESKSTFFMTDGWMKGERNIWVEYQYCIEKYGKKTGQWIFDTMMGEYTALGMVDTGCYSLAEVEEEARRMARDMKLEYRVHTGTTVYLQELLADSWDASKFLIVSPGTKITANDQIALS